MSSSRNSVRVGVSKLLNLEHLFKPARLKVLTPLLGAAEELRRRQMDPHLRKKVEDYLKDDIPDHFRKEPILYLARHIATPNFETLRFLHLTEPLDMSAIIGQDVNDKFVPSDNLLKRALGKLSISKGISHKDKNFHEHFANVTVIDFNSSSGKQLKDVRTLWGEDLVGFHNRLFRTICKNDVRIVDDSAWIDRQERGKLLEHYKRFLALFIVHGILFEDIELEHEGEIRFIQKILIPAFQFVEKKFGVRPLISQLIPTSVESPRFWLSYPHVVQDAIQKKRVVS